MVRKCAVKGCWVTEADQGKMLISFPRDSVRRTVWLNGVCLNESNFRKSWKICEVSFASVCTMSRYEGKRLVYHL